MQRKKILWVNGHLKPGGIEKSLLDILRNLDYNRYEVDLLLIEDQGEYLQQLPSEVRVIFKDLTNTYGSFVSSMKRSFSEKDSLSMYARLVFLLKKIFGKKIYSLLLVPLLGNKKYDVAIGFRTGFSSDIVHYACHAKKKIIWWHHGEINLSEIALKSFEKTVNNFENAVVVSKPISNVLEQKMPSIKNFLQIIPNMVDQSLVQHMSKLFQPNFDDTRKNFVTVSRISPEKHIENVIFATDFLVKKGFKNFCWHIIGEGEDLEELIQLSQEKNLKEYIIFHGKKANPFPYVLHADLYIHTSYVESQGLSILEAMALQTPCIITENDGVKDYADESNCIMVEKNPEALADAILEILNNEEQYSKLKKNTHVPERFGVQEVIEKIDLLLTES